MEITNKNEYAEKFMIIKNTKAECYVADSAGIILNELHKTGNIHYKKGD